MPVDTKHAEYTANAGKWGRMRDVAAGQDAVWRAGERYLPKLIDETPERYLARQHRAGFFNATRRTITGLVGMLFRKAPVVKLSARAQAMLSDVTKSGVSFDAFAKQVAVELETVGRVGVLVDYPKGEPGAKPLSVTDAEALNLRPHLALYQTESVINWDTAWRNNKSVVSLVVLAEHAAIPDPTDRFLKTTEQRWRVLELDEAGLYQQTVYAKRNGVDTVVEGPLLPEQNSKRLDYIPFQFFSMSDTTPTVEDPPLLDMAEVNISHYQTTADLEHGAHKTALPQPWISGPVHAETDENGRPIEKKLYIGGGECWMFPPDTEVGMLEFTGAGLIALEKRREVKEQQMAVLGARMLEAQKTGVEAAETAGIHRSGEQSALQGQAATMSAGFVGVLGWFDAWAGGPGKAECKINDDFVPAGMTPQELAELVAAWQSGAISKEALFEKLQNGGVISDARKFEDEETKIENSPPTLLADPAPVTE